jgi:uncharacterized protein (UPF0303 family)
MPRVTDYQATAQDSATIAALCAASEAEFRFRAFSPDTAWRVGNAIRDQFLAKYSTEAGVRAGIVIHIETFTGHTLFSAAVGLPSATGPDNWYVEKCSGGEGGRDAEA